MKIKETFIATESNINSIIVTLQNGNEESDYKIEKHDITHFDEDDRMLQKEIQYKIYLSENLMWCFDDKFTLIAESSIIPENILSLFQKINSPKKYPEEVVPIIRPLFQLTEIIRHNPNIFLKQTGLFFQLVDCCQIEYKEWIFEISNTFNEAQSIYDSEKATDTGKQIFVYKSKTNEPVMAIYYIDDKPDRIWLCKQKKYIKPCDMVLNLADKKIPLTMRECYRDVVELARVLQPDNERFSKLRNKHLNFLNSFEKKNKCEEENSIVN